MRFPYLISISLGLLKWVSADIVKPVGYDSTTYGTYPVTINNDSMELNQSTYEISMSSNSMTQPTVLTNEPKSEGEKKKLNEEMEKERDRLKESYDPAHCWDNAEDWLELLDDLKCGNWGLEEEYIGVDFNADYYGWKLMLKALIECPRNEMRVHDDYFVYECHCTDGVPRIKPAYCRDGKNGANMEPDSEGSDFLDWTDEDWTDCDRNQNGTLVLKKVHVKSQKTVKVSKAAGMRTKGRGQKGRRRRRSIAQKLLGRLKGTQTCSPPLHPFPTKKGFCTPGLTYCDDQEFIYSCDQQRNLLTTHCLLTNEVDGKNVIKKVLEKGERANDDQFGTFLCQNCRVRGQPLLCLIYQDVSAEVVSTSK